VFPLLFFKLLILEFETQAGLKVIEDLPVFSEE
jgi:hypothetical protein